MTAARRTVGLLVAVAWTAIGAGALEGCASSPREGYAAVSPFPAGVRTVGVPILDNDTFVRGVEFELTDALVKSIESRTPYKVTDPTRADSILLGRIRRVDLEQLSKSRLTGLGEEVVVTMTIDFEWRDTHTQRVLVERKSFTGHGLFVPSAPTGERIELGRFASVQALAEDIVDEMQAAW